MAGTDYCCRPYLDTEQSSCNLQKKENITHVVYNEFTEKNGGKVTCNSYVDKGVLFACSKVYINFTLKAHLACIQNSSSKAREIAFLIGT